ncbi:MAG: polysaccharide biosynthesis tyrosine autokinase [Parvibaculaceae bacterium]|nr:polysaccharide biosynthesis tyrosine autokinase [Parvibaculaceae bacterium]
MASTINDQQLSELNAQLILARTDLAEKESRLGGAQQVARSGGNTDSITEVLQSSVIGDLRSQEAALTAKQADLSAKYGPRHPAIINIEAQRRDIEVQISSEVRRIIAGLSNDVSASRSRVLSLSNSLNELQQRNAKNNSATVKLNELQRQASANQALYESFLGRFKQTSQDQGIESADARIISEAVPPNSASYPKTGLVLFVAFGFSVIAGIALALVVERLDNSFKTVGELESSLQIPNMATIPLFRAVKDEGGNRVSIDRYVLLKPMSAFAEAFRGLRSSLQLSNVDNPPKVVLFTSAIPSEGKSTCSISFARSAAMAGHSVVIIDCDWRHPTIAKFTHTEKPTVGVIDLLVGRATFEEAMQQDAYSSVICIPAISGTMNPPDVLGSEQMKHLIQELRSKFDFVVLDTPPVLPVIDACVLSHLADKSVLVVRWNNTERSATLSAYRKLLEFGSDVAGTVFTQVDPARQAQYGYGDTHYYYSGRYGKYYQN